MVNSAAKKRKPKAGNPIQLALFWVTSGFVALALIMMAIGVNYLHGPENLPIRFIQVKGEFKHLKEGDVEKRVTDVINGGFFSVDMHAVREAALSVPWVEEVSVRRVWPDKLVMNVTEHVALARWKRNAYVNVSGAVFKPKAEDGLQGLVSLSGPDGSSARVVDFYQHVQKVSKSIGLTVVKLSLDERRDWQVVYDNGIELALGKDNVAHRLNEFMRVYPRLSALPEKFPKRIDMRYEHGFAVKWQEATKSIASDSKGPMIARLGGGV